MATMCSKMYSSIIKSHYFSLNEGEVIAFEKLKYSYRNKEFLALVKSSRTNFQEQV